MSTIEQFVELIKPQNGITVVDQYIDLDRIAFLKENITQLSMKLSKTRMTKIGALQGQISRLSSKRKSEHKLKLASTDGYGRVTPIAVSDIAMVNMTRPVRQFLVRDYSTDIDMVNSHPVIMNNLYMMAFDEAIHELDVWNTNRDAFFKTIVSHANKSNPVPSYTKDDAKKVAFIWLYEGKVNHYFKEMGLDINDPEIEPIYRLVHKLKGRAIKLAEYIATKFKTTWDALPCNAAPDRERCSKLSKLFQHIERRLIVDTMLPVVHHSGYGVMDVCHDGLLVFKPGPIPEPLSNDEISALLPLLNKAALDAFGFKLTMTHKDMKSKIDSDDTMGANYLDKWFFKSNDPMWQVCNDLEASEKFINVYKNRLVFCNAEWYARPLDEYFWRKGEGIVKNCIAKCGFYKGSGKTKRPYGSDSTGINNIFKMLKDGVVYLTDDDFVAKNNRRFVGIVHWEDKHLCQSNPTKFIVNDPKADYAPFIYIKRKAPGSTMVNPADEVKLNKLLKGLDDEQCLALYRFTGRMAYGNISDKKWVVLEGERHTSKSTLTIIIYNAFDGLCTTVSPPFIQVCNTDDGAKNRWVLSTGCHIFRIAIFAEKTTNVDMNGKAIVPVIDGNLIKKIFANGGNDRVIARYHSSNETSIVINTCFLGSLNGLPSASPCDAIDTLIPISMKIKFTENPDDVKKYPNNFLLRDQTIADYVNDPGVIDCFVMCCLSKYYLNEPFEPKPGSDMANEVSDVKANLGEVTMMSVYQDCFIPEDKDDNNPAYADLVVDKFREKIGNPNLTVNKVTSFLKGFGHNKACRIDKSTNMSRKYYTTLTMI